MVSWILFGVLIYIFITAHLAIHVLDLAEEYECQRHYKEYINKINVVHQQYFTNNGIHA